MIVIHSIQNVFNLYQNTPPRLCLLLSDVSLYIEAHYTVSTLGVSMSKAPFMCKIFGHSYNVVRDVISSYQVCSSCNHMTSQIDHEVYLYEGSQWQAIALSTGRSLACLENDQHFRTQVWEAVSHYRQELDKTYSTGV